VSLESEAESMTREEILSLLKAHRELQEYAQELARQVEWFKRQLFGPKSERRIFDSGGRQLTFGELRLSEPTETPTIEVAAHRRRRSEGNGAEEEEETLRFDPSVPVEEIEVPNPEMEGKNPDDYVVVGQKVTCRLAQRPGSYVVLRYVRKVYKRKTDGVFSCPPAPPVVLEKSCADVSFLAGLLIDKFRFHRVPRMHKQTAERQKGVQCCLEDEGRPLGIGLQGRISNHLKLRWSRARVVSVEGKGMLQHAR
jgi:transposase